LEHVILDRTSATDELAKFANDNPPPSLNSIGIHGCKLTPHGMAALQAALPLFTVVETSEYGLASLRPPAPCPAQTIRLYRSAGELLWNLGVAGFQTDAKTVEGIRLIGDRRWSGDWSSSVISRIKGLNNLSLEGCHLSAEALEQLHKQDQLEHLDLSNSSIDDGAIGQLTNLQRLKWLDLSHTKVTDEGLESLSCLGSLEHLELSDTKVTDRGVRSLRSLLHLSSLGLESCQITDDAAQELAGITELTYLKLDHTRVTDRSVAALAKLPQLRRLNLAGCKVTDEGAEHLLDVPKLETFSLEGTAVSAVLKTRLATHVANVKSQRPSPNDPTYSNNYTFQFMSWHEE
jgi:hypothetical protein